MSLYGFVFVGGQDEPEIDKLLQENDGQQLDFEKGWFAGVDPEFLEWGFVCSGSVVECLTQDREATGLSLTGVTSLCH